ncbi:transposase [Massilia sp. CCM 8734]|uniref:REP-associated tyrosine transposase n=1 Tax=Massilia sp. CCM 8734 TaxID=2609283 RepID=UPI00141F980B|nr:transposase [Massilia sp. CCM 8734]NHZ94946.1 addiction module toxin RelE [Massilia sp. CCM 8734]
MTRPLRLEFPGALYHVTARGNRRHPIYLDDADRRAWFGALRDACARSNCVVHAYCQMNNHFHLLIETIDGNLSAAMRQLNGNFSRGFNRRHNTVGHLFQGRYHAVLVQKESYLLELARYIVLNPVRAGLVALPQDWEWSSYRWMRADADAPSWLDTQWLLNQFGSTPEMAVAAYRDFVARGMGAENPLKSARHALLLGESLSMENFHSAAHSVPSEIVRLQRGISSMSLTQYQSQFAERDEAMARAFWSTVFTMKQIGVHFGVSYKTVSRAVQRYEAQLQSEVCKGNEMVMPHVQATRSTEDD